VVNVTLTAFKVIKVDRLVQIGALKVLAADWAREKAF